MIQARRCFRSLLLFLPATILAAAPAGAFAAPAAPPTLTASQIVQRMDRQNQLRAAELKSYTDLRHYSVAYHGFPVSLKASMVVEASYQAPRTKTFRIVSARGPGLLVDHVLKRLLAAEKEAALHPSEASISPANYSFTLLGAAALDGRPCYILRADPKSASHLLFSGKIWVDAAQFAVVQVEAEPARSPSFWIRDTHIHHVYAQTGAFWLPQSDRSTTNLRFGGTAVLTIDYGVYHTIPPASGE